MSERDDPEPSSPEPAQAVALDIDDRGIVAPKRHPWWLPLLLIGGTGGALAWRLEPVGYLHVWDMALVPSLLLIGLPSVLLAPLFTGLIGHIGMDRITPYGATVGMLSAICLSAIVGGFEEHRLDDIVFFAVLFGFVLSFAFVPLAIAGAWLGCCLRRKLGDPSEDDDLLDLL